MNLGISVLSDPVATISLVDEGAMGQLVNENAWFCSRCCWCLPRPSQTLAFPGR